MRPHFFTITFLSSAPLLRTVATESKTDRIAKVAAWKELASDEQRVLRHFEADWHALSDERWQILRKPLKRRREESFV